MDTNTANILARLENKVDKLFELLREIQVNQARSEERLEAHMTEDDIRHEQEARDRQSIREQMKTVGTDVSDIQDERKVSKAKFAGALVVLTALAGIFSWIVGQVAPLLVGPSK